MSRGDFDYEQMEWLEYELVTFARGSQEINRPDVIQYQKQEFIRHIGDLLLFNHSRYSRNLYGHSKTNHSAFAQHDSILSWRTRIWENICYIYICIHFSSLAHGICG